jgi:hypothetical protein
MSICPHCRHLARAWISRYQPYPTRRAIPNSAQCVFGVAWKDQASRPDIAYVRIRDPVEEDYEYDGNSVRLTSSKADLNQYKEPLTSTGWCQRRLDGSPWATIESLTALAMNDFCLKTGLCYYKDRHRFVRAFLNTETSEIVFEVI